MTALDGTGDATALLLARWPGRGPDIGAVMRLDVNGEVGWWRVTAIDALVMTLSPHMPTWGERWEVWQLGHVWYSPPARAWRAVTYAAADWWRWLTHRDDADA